MTMPSIQPIIPLIAPNGDKVYCNAIDLPTRMANGFKRLEDVVEKPKPKGRKPKGKPKGESKASKESAPSDEPQTDRKGPPAAPAGYGGKGAVDGASD